MNIYILGDSVEPIFYIPFKVRLTSFQLVPLSLTTLKDFDA